MIEKLWIVGANVEKILPKETLIEERASTHCPKESLG